jgi:hypothetical protein
MMCGILIGEKGRELKPGGVCAYALPQLGSLGLEGTNVGRERGIATLPRDQTVHKLSSRCSMVLSVVLRVPRSHARVVSSSPISLLTLDVKDIF